MAVTIDTTPSAKQLELFHELAAEWKSQSRYLSNTLQIVTLRPYQRIIGMGEVAIPLILDELRKEPRQWFWALEAISGENPVPAADFGEVEKRAKAWITWGIANGWLQA